MPHQNVTSSNATAQNAATDPTQPNDQAREQHQSARSEPRSYVASDSADATLAPPAAGEVADFMDEGSDLEGAAVQRGRSNANRPAATEAQSDQGPKTKAAQRQQLKTGNG